MIGVYFVVIKTGYCGVAGAAPERERCFILETLP